MNKKKTELYESLYEAGITMSVIKYLNSRMPALQGLTSEQAYYVTASAFKANLTEDQWNKLKGDENSKTVIKKIANEVFKPSALESENSKASGTASIDKPDEKEEDLSTMMDTNEDISSIRKKTDDAREMNKVSVGDRKVNFHIELTAEFEQDIIQMLAEGKFSEAHEFMHGFVYESLQAQLSEEDLIWAQNPADFQIRKLGIGSNVELVTQFRNKSLIEALTCAHLGLAMVKKQELDKQKAEAHKFDHFRDKFYSALDERIINDDKGAVAKVLIEESGILSTGVEETLCPMCDHLEKHTAEKVSSTETIMNLDDKELSEKLIQEEREQEEFRQKEQEERQENAEEIATSLHQRY